MSKEINSVDFDGTSVENDYPKIGKDVTHAVRVLKRLDANDCYLILYTMRCARYLVEAITWFGERGIPLWAVNQNPQQAGWTSSVKVYAHINIDDAALGCPLVIPVNGSEKRPYVDWLAVEKLLEERGVFDLEAGACYEL